MAEMKFTKTEAKRKIDLILSLLRVVPMHTHDLAELIPMSRRWTLTYVKHLHQNRRIYILRWEKHIAQRAKRHAVPVYAPGRRPDAPKPEADTDEVVYQRAWNRLKSDPDRHGDLLAKRRVRRRLRNLRPDPAAAWIFPTK